MDTNPGHSLYAQQQSLEKKTEHLVMAIMEDKPGVFSRIAGLFRRRNFNIKSITAGNCEHDGMSRMTVVVDGTKTITEQLIKQLSKVIEVIEVTDLPEDVSVMRELALIKVSLNSMGRAELNIIIQNSGARIVHENDGSIIVELTGTPEIIDSFLVNIKKFGLSELARTGVVAMKKG